MLGSTSGFLIKEGGRCDCWDELVLESCFDTVKHGCWAVSQL
jgi:hypothetical protein